MHSVAVQRIPHSSQNGMKFSNPFDEKKCHSCVLTTLLTGISSLGAFSIYLMMNIASFAAHRHVSSQKPAKEEKWKKKSSFFICPVKLKSTFSNGSYSTACIVVFDFVVLFVVHILIIISFVLCAFRIIIWCASEKLGISETVSRRSDWVCMLQWFRYSLKKVRKKRGATEPNSRHTHKKKKGIPNCDINEAVLRILWSSSLDLDHL